MQDFSKVESIVNLISGIHTEGQLDFRIIVLPLGRLTIEKCSGLKYLLIFLMYILIFRNFKGSR